MQLAFKHKYIFAKTKRLCISQGYMRKSDIVHLSILIQIERFAEEIVLELLLFFGILFNVTVFTYI